MPRKRALPLPRRRASSSCRLCGGSGMRQITRTVRTSAGHEYEAHGSVQCPCVGGPAVESDQMKLAAGDR